MSEVGKAKALKRRVTFSFDERKSEAVAAARAKTTRSAMGDSSGYRRSSAAVVSSKVYLDFTATVPRKQSLGISVFKEGSDGFAVTPGTVGSSATGSTKFGDYSDLSMSKEEGSLMESISEMDSDEAGKAVVVLGEKGVSKSSAIGPSLGLALSESSSSGSATASISLEASSSRIILDDDEDEEFEDEEAGEGLASPHGVFTIPFDMFPVESSRRRSSKSIMKFTIQDELLLRRINLRMEKEAASVEFAKGSTLVLKWSRLGKPVKRWIKVSEDASCLEIVSKSLLKTHVRKVELADVHSAMYGPRTHAFDNFNWRSDYPWRCFSIIMKDRTWDFQAETDEAALNWFYALQCLSPLNKFYMSWGKLLWMKVIYRSIRSAVCARTPVNLLWLQLVLDAKNFEEMGV